MKKEVFFIVFCLLFLGIVSASIELGNKSHFIEREYPKNGTISGWINMSLEDESLDSIFRDSFENSFNLSYIINKNSNLVNCSTKNCSYDYETGIPEKQKSFFLSDGSSILLGIKLYGKIDDVNSINFDVSSNAQASCTNQLKIDFFNDETYEWGNSRSASNVCSDLKNYGCFNTSEITQYYSLSTTPYCQKINLTEAPGYRVGANVKKTGTGSSELAMFLYDGNKNVGSCGLQDATTSGGEIACDIDYLVTRQKEYYVCVYSKTPGIYSLNGSSSPKTKCGFYGIPVKSSTTAYQIFAQKKEFASVGSLNVNDSLQSGKILSSSIMSYLRGHYKSLDCEMGCIVPIRISSQKDQTVIIKNFKMFYDRDSGNVLSDDLYEIYPVSPRISSKSQKFSLDSLGLRVPNNYGNFSYEIAFNDVEIISDSITVGRIPTIKDLYPKIAPSNYPTEFVVLVESDNSTIVSYEWNFGGSIQRTTTNKTIFTFTKAGINSLKVTVKDSKNKSSSKSFEINIYVPKNLIDEEVILLENKLVNVKSEIEKLPPFYQTSVESLLDIENADNKIEEIKTKYGLAVSDEDYAEVSKLINEVSLPQRVYVSSYSDNFIYYPKKQNINLEVLKEINSEEYDSEKEDKYKSAILNWQMENFDAKMSFKEISIQEGKENYDLVKFFEIDYSPNGELSENPYFIIGQLDNLEFEEDYEFEEASGYNYKELDGPTKFVFSTTESIEFYDLPVFISPSLSYFSFDENGNVIKPKKNSKWPIFFLVLIILIILFIIVYYFLARWYKEKYESHLFKNRNNLFNLLTYIGNSKRKGMNEKDIREKLKKAGWTGEQVDYAIKKYYGKKVGMFGFFGRNKEQTIKTNNGFQYSSRNNLFGERKYL